MHSEFGANANKVQMRGLCAFYCEISHEGLNNHNEILALTILNYKIMLNNYR